jgi:hypothetical protein
MSALTTDAVHFIEGLANEGVPICAIARSFSKSAGEVKEVLDDARGRGVIVELPQFDWPPGTSRMRRLPAFMSKISPADFIMAVRDLFKLTVLEAEFVRVLVYNNRADKPKLHSVALKLRVDRSTKPNSYDDTDPKMVDVVICHLRKKLTKHEVTIKTLWGSGYFLDEEQRKNILGRVEKFFAEQVPANDNSPEAGCNAGYGLGPSGPSGPRVAA